jgi:hypothetical protein
MGVLLTVQVIPAQLKPLGYQQISAATLATATSLTVPAGAVRADFGVNPTGTAVRYRDDGTAPTAALGMVINGLNYPPLPYTGDLAKIQFILSTGAPILDVLYYGNA